jgi:hypothetical protein
MIQVTPAPRAATAPQAQAAPAQAAPAQPAAPASPATTIEQTVQRAIDEAIRSSQQQAMSRTERQNAIRQSVRDAINQIRADARDRAGDNTATVGVPQFGPDFIPPQAVEISKAFFSMLVVIIVGLPLARAFARRMDRRGAVTQAPSDLSPRLDRIEQAIEAVAIEVERISESQRYATKVMSELRGLPAPNPMESWPTAKADAVAEPRRG